GAHRRVRREPAAVPRWERTTQRPRPPAQLLKENTPMLTDTKAQVFSLKAPLLSSGNQDTPLYTTDLMWMHVKVYAEGGENDLHAHPEEEHSFIVLDGEATFVDADGTETKVTRNEGILLP